MTQPPRNAEFLPESEPIELTEDQKAYINHMNVLYPQPRKGWWRRVRDTVTGRFTRTEEAEKRPETTVSETVERKPEPPEWTGVR